MQAFVMSASKDALWIEDMITKLPFKFDEKTSQFQQKGNRQVDMIAAGVNGHALMERRNKNFSYGGLYGWIQEDNMWRSLGGGMVDWVASGRGGRLYKLDYPSRKVF